MVLLVVGFLCAVIELKVLGQGPGSSHFSVLVKLELL